MNNIHQKKWLLELLWIIVSAIVAIMVMIPIQRNATYFPFTVYNVIYVFVAIHFTRYIFLLKYTPFAKSLWFKLIMIFTAIPIIVLLTDGMSEFQANWDYTGFQDFLGHLRPEKHLEMTRYIKAEYIFFGVSAVITAILMPIRMIVSIWRVRNRNTV